MQSTWKIKEISIRFRDRDITKALEQLKLNLPYMKSLKSLKILGLSGDLCRRDVSTIFVSINKNIESISLCNVDIPKGISEEITRNLKKLEEFDITEFNIPTIPFFPNKNCRVNISKLDKISKEDCIEYKIKNRNLVSDYDEELREIKYKEYLPLYLYEKYPDLISFYENKCIWVKDISELTLEKLQILKTDERIKSIVISYGPLGVKEYFYSIDECITICEEIDKIISKVEIQKDDDTNREKKIFAQVYKLLGKRISYGDYACCKKGERDCMLVDNCRN